MGFFKGALLKDPKNLLVQLGRTQAGRVMKFTSVSEIAAQTKIIKAYVQRSYLYHIAGAKQPATRIARIEKAKPDIFAVTIME